MKLEVPEWALKFDEAPEEVRQKLLELVPVGSPWPDAFVSTVEMFVSNFAHNERERVTRKDIYDRVKRKKGMKNPPPLTEHAGEELELILKTAIDAYNAILAAGARSKHLLERELRHKVGKRYATPIGFDPCDREDFYPMLPLNYTVLNGTTHLLLHIIDAIDPSKTKAEDSGKGLLGQVGRRRPKEYKAELVRDLGREYRCVLGRVPTQSEMEKFLSLIFGDNHGIDTKRWVNEANDTPLPSEILDYLKNDKGLDLESVCKKEELMPYIREACDALYNKQPRESSVKEFDESKLERLYKALFA